MLAASLKQRKSEAWSQLLFCAGVAVSLACTLAAVEEIAVDPLSKLSDRDVHVAFSAEFSDGRFEILPGGRSGVESFVRVFKDELETATQITSSESIEVPVAKSPPLVLDGRAVFRGAETPFPHTEEAVDFISKLTGRGAVAVQVALINALERRGYGGLGPVVLNTTGRPIIHQDVTVVIPQEEAKPAGNSTTTFFEKNPEVLVTLVVLAGLLSAILLTAWWYIWREHCRRRAGVSKPVSVEVQDGNSKQVKKKTASYETHSSASHRDRVSTANNQNGDKLPSKKRLEFDTLDFIEKIGTGSFKTVYRGRWSSNNVAIARMRKGGVLMEARLMEKLSSNPNLVTYYRWTVDHKGNEYIVMELVENGALDKVLRQHAGQVGMKVKVAMCAQICQAMCQLAKENVVHRDLAARNVLVQSLDPPCVKVSDFGLSKYVSPGLQASNTFLNDLPIRWIPPEVIVKQEWSEKSDVWAFGITMWEIFSDAREPYAEEGCSDDEVARTVKKGVRLPQPKGCPDEMYAMMLECWHTKPSDRPNFTELSRRFHVNGRALSVPALSMGCASNEVKKGPSGDGDCRQDSESAAPEGDPKGGSISRAQNSTDSGIQRVVQPVSWNSAGSEELTSVLDETSSVSGSGVRPDGGNRRMESKQSRHVMGGSAPCVSDLEDHSSAGNRSALLESALDGPHEESGVRQPQCLQGVGDAKGNGCLASVPEHQHLEGSKESTDTRPLLREDEAGSATDGRDRPSRMPSVGPYRKIKDVVDGGVT